MVYRKALKSVKHEKRHTKLDITNTLVLLALLTLSCIMVYSASMIGNKYGIFTSSVPVETTYFLKRQAIWAVLSFVTFIFISVAIPFEVFRDKNILQYGFFAMVILLVIPFASSSINGARSWIRLGALSFQPSTLAQLFIIIYMAFILETRKDKLRKVCTSNELINIFWIPLFLIAIIFLQNDTGMMLITLSVVGIMTLCSNMHFKNIKRLLTLAVMAIVIVVALLFVKSAFSSGSSYRTNRIKVFLNPFSEDLSAAADQVINSYIAFGNGGLFGRGLGNSIQKLGYLPEAHTDFILFVIGLLTALICRVIIAGTKSRNTFAAMYCIGFASLLVVQSVVNIGGVTASIPMTGVPLPFVSNGGSSMFILSIGLGIATNVLAHVKYIRGNK